MAQLNTDQLVFPKPLKGRYNSALISEDKSWLNLFLAEDLGKLSNLPWPGFLLRQMERTMVSIMGTVNTE